MEILIVLAAATVVFFIYRCVRIFVKRVTIVSKFRRLCRKNDIMYTVNSRFRSLFYRGEKPDLVFEKEGKIYDVYIFSSIVKYARYHFTLEGEVEFYRKERGFMPLHIGYLHRSIAANSMTYIYEGRVTSHKNFLISENGNEKLLIVHPAPLQITGVKGNGAKPVYDGETLYGNVKFYTGRGLRKLLDEEEAYK